MSSTDMSARGKGRRPASDPALRRQAEAIADDALGTARDVVNVETMSLEATRAMLHELHVHQIELEMQNDELRRAQVALETARANYFDLYDLAPVGYCTVSEQGLIRQANLTAATLLGMARNALAKQPVSKYILQADQDIFYLNRQQLFKTGEPQACELRMVKCDGTHFWARLAITLARDDGGAPVLRMALTDITASKTAEAAMRDSEERYRVLSEELQEKNIALEGARSAADRANRAKSDFLSSMSHELRTPLSAILGFAQLLDSGSPPASSQKQAVDQILRAGWYLLDLINEILDLAMIESGKLPLHMESVSLADVLRECQSMVEPQAQKRGIVMTYPRFELPCVVVADRTRIKQIFINLLSNAIKYNKPGGTVVVDCAPSDAGRIRIGVTDTGEGLSPDKVTQLFQSFNRLGQEAKVAEGTGIGLVVCKRLIELMDGVIGVESTVGQGSVFWVELNQAKESQYSAGASLPAAAGAGS